MSLLSLDNFTPRIDVQFEAKILPQNLRKTSKLIVICACHENILEKE